MSRLERKLVMPHYTVWNEVTARYKILLEKNERFDIAIERCKHIYNYAFCDISVCPGACATCAGCPPGMSLQLTVPQQY